MQSADVGSNWYSRHVEPPNLVLSDGVRDARTKIDGPEGAGLEAIEPGGEGLAERPRFAAV